MNASQIYILISIIVLAIIAIVVVLRRKKEQKPLSKLTALAFSFIIAGIIFGENRLIGYSLIGVGVVLAIIDIVKKMKRPSVKSD
jgi:lipoprotein signal peptidase